MVLLSKLVFCVSIIHRRDSFVPKDSLPHLGQRSEECDRGYRISSAEQRASSQSGFVRLPPRRSGCRTQTDPQSDGNCREINGL